VSGTFGTWQGRLAQELRLAGLEGLAEANQFLKQTYVIAFNEKFAAPLLALLFPTRARLFKPVEQS
jgi:hypothetical protein